MNCKLSLSSLIDLQKEVVSLKEKKRSDPVLDQIDRFPFKKRGGKRSGAGRPRSTETTTIRIPVTLLKTVTEIKNGTHTPEQPSNLKSVTEIKDDDTAALAIHALRQYFRTEYMMGDDDIAFEMWIKNTLETTP